MRQRRKEMLVPKLEPIVIKAVDFARILKLAVVLSGVNGAVCGRSQGLVHQPHASVDWESNIGARNGVLHHDAFLHRKDLGSPKGLDSDFLRFDEKENLMADSSERKQDKNTYKLDIYGAAGMEAASVHEKAKEKKKKLRRRQGRVRRALATTQASVTTAPLTTASPVTSKKAGSSPDTGDSQSSADDVVSDAAAEGTSYSRCRWERDYTENKFIHADSGRVDWEEPIQSCCCYRKVSWHIRLASDNQSMVLHISHFSLKWYESMEVYTSKEPSILQRSPAIPTSVQFVPGREVWVEVRTLPWPFQTVEGSPSRFSLVFTSHPRDQLPAKSLFVPYERDTRAAPLVSSGHYYDCSPPYTVPAYVRCDMVRQCLGGEDEPNDCPYRSAGCGQDTFPVGSKCVYVARADDQFYTGEDEACDSDSQLATLPEPEQRLLVAGVAARMGVAEECLRVDLSKRQDRNPLYDRYPQLFSLYRFMWQWGGSDSSTGGVIDHGDLLLQQQVSLGSSGALRLAHGQVFTTTYDSDQCRRVPAGFLCMKAAPGDNHTQQEEKAPQDTPATSVRLRSELSPQIPDGGRFKRCADGSFVYVFHTCPPGQPSQDDRAGDASKTYRCLTGGTVHYSLLCDGHFDCPDWSDETGCAAPQDSRLRDTYFVCSSSQLVPLSKRCDGAWDCFDRSDEQSCATCTAGKVFCSGYGCLPQSYASFLPCQLDSSFVDSVETDFTLPDAQFPPSQEELERCGGPSVDLVILLDSSGSITVEKYQFLLEQIRLMIQMLSIESGRVRVGLLIFSTRPLVIFDLNSFYDVEGMIEETSKTTHLYGSTFTAEALKVARTQMFTEYNGDRPDAMNILLLITDGFSIEPLITIEEAEMLKNDGVRIFSLGINLRLTDELDAIASSPKEVHVFNSKTFEGAFEFMYQIATALCPGEGILPVPSTAKREIIGENRFVYPPAVLELDSFGMSTIRTLKTPYELGIPDELPRIKPISNSSFGNTTVSWCPESHFLCPRGFCIPTYLLNNRIMDCPTGDDENIANLNCPGFYRCQETGNCLHQDSLCDDINHCPLNDDERYCQLLNDCPATCTCEGLAFNCSTTLDFNNHLQLRYLDLSGSENQDLQGIEVLEYLHLLNLSFCKLRGINFDSMTQLQVLDLSHNGIESFDALQLNPVKELLHLNLSYNPLPKFLGQAFANFLQNAKMIKLKSLMMVGVGLELVTSKDMADLPRLSLLDIRSNPVDVREKEVFGLALQELFTDNSKLCCEQFHATQLSYCHAPVDELSSCSDLLKSDFLRGMLWVLAAMALTGNAGVLIYRAFLERQGTSLAYRVLVIHLGGADLLMGVYMAIIGGADAALRGVYVLEEDAWRASALCKAAGFLAMLSSEVSAFVICLITLDRFLLLKFPFSKCLRLSRFSACLTCIGTWAAGTILAVVPLAAPHWQFYGVNGICLPLPVTRRQFNGHKYAFAIFIVLNFILFVFIGVGQLSLYRVIKQSAKAAQKDSRRQDITIARRLFLIVFTDFCCWFPIGVMGLLAWRGVPISDTVSVWAAVVVLPLNSALNPFLYTLNMLLERRAAKKDHERLLRMMTNLHVEMRGWPRDKLLLHTRQCLISLGMATGDMTELTSVSGRASLSDIHLSQLEGKQLGKEETSGSTKTEAGGEKLDREGPKRLVGEEGGRLDREEGSN